MKNKYKGITGSPSNSSKVKLQTIGNTGKNVKFFYPTPLQRNLGRNKILGMQ